MKKYLKHKAKDIWRSIERGPHVDVTAIRDDVVVQILSAFGIQAKDNSQL